MNADHEIAILELGISRKGEMEKLTRIADLDIGLITNISETHLEHLGDIQTVAREKEDIFIDFNSSDHYAILNHDDYYCRRMATGLRCPVITFGLSEEAHYTATQIEPAGQTGYWFTLHYPEGQTRLYLNAPGKHNIYNALAAIATARSLGASLKAIQVGLEEFHLPQMRLEIHTSSILEENVTIINDTYNASPASMTGALSALQEMAGPNRTIALLGDMLELGNFSVTAHENIGIEVVNQGLDLLFTIGTLASNIGRKAIEAGMKTDEVIHCQDIVEAAELLQTTIREGDFILIKGSRLMQLDLLAAQFIGGIRPTKLIIDLEAIAHNIRKIREIVGSNIKIMSVVKSGGYGHDSRKVARVVLENGIDYLAVAVPDEGVFLRKSGFESTPILVLGPTLPQEAIKVVKYRLAQTVHSLPVVAELNKEAEKKGVQIPVHVKIDTGMGRIGLLPDQVESFFDTLVGFNNISI
ncbi:alanine racemase, partial [candidate division CSSED10-310 bacterium]